MAHPFRDRPPSTRRLPGRSSASSAMASIRSRVWYATDASAARTTSAAPESRVSPTRAARASASQWGAPRPVKAGTR